MTDDTTDRASADAQPGKDARRRWVSTLALVCVAAIAGGAGTVLMASGDSELGTELAGEYGSGKRIRGRCERPIEHTFNPRVVRGSRSKLAKVAFRFEYETDPRHRDLVKRRIEQNWDLMYSRTLQLLRRRTVHELSNAETNISRTLEEELSQTITRTCFPDGVATVDRINFVQILVQ